jgi:hypothetical protein
VSQFEGDVGAAMLVKSSFGEPLDREELQLHLGITRELNDLEQLVPGYDIVFPLAGYRCGAKHDEHLTRFRNVAVAPPQVRACAAVGHCNSRSRLFALAFSSSLTVVVVVVVVIVVAVAAAVVVSVRYLYRTGAFYSASRVLAMIFRRVTLRIRATFWPQFTTARISSWRRTVRSRPWTVASARL